jgi:hypothetical protein
MGIEVNPSTLWLTLTHCFGQIGPTQPYNIASQPGHPSTKYLASRDISVQNREGLGK